jgi:hypothetical protein
MAFNDTTTVILLCNTGATTSQMCFYNDVPTSEDGEAPADTASVAPATGSGFITWEGQQITGGFANHLLFTTQIRGTAASQPPGTQVGTGYHSPPFAPPPPGQPPYGYNVFNIYRDNDRVVYTDPTLGGCSTIYYCTFVSTRTFLC